MNRLRVFYTPSGAVIGSHGLVGPGDFFRSVESHLTDYPSGTQCLEVDNSEQIQAFVMAETNSISNGRLIIGAPRPILPPASIATWQTEIQGLRVEIGIIKSRLGIS